jgi:hypothetical protein
MQAESYHQQDTFFRNGKYLARIGKREELLFET